jgi:hypothetical protein
MQWRPDGHGEGTMSARPKVRAHLPEPLVSATKAARFLSIPRPFLLSLARQGIGGAYAIGPAKANGTWVFRLSELGVAIDHRHPRPFPDKPHAR